MGPALRGLARPQRRATSALDFCVSGALGSDQLDFASTSNSINCIDPIAIGTDPVQILIVGNSAAATMLSPAYR